jgi:hypothetical protein
VDRVPASTRRQAVARTQRATYVHTGLSRSLRTNLPLACMPFQTGFGALYHCCYRLPSQSQDMRSDAFFFMRASLMPAHRKAAPSGAPAISLPPSQPSFAYPFVQRQAVPTCTKINDHARSAYQESQQSCIPHSTPLFSFSRSQRTCWLEPSSYANCPVSVEERPSAQFHTYETEHPTHPKRALFVASMLRQA